MNIFESVREDRLIRREISGKLSKTHGDTDARKRLFRELKPLHTVPLQLDHK